MSSMKETAQRCFRDLVRCGLEKGGGITAEVEMGETGRVDEQLIMSGFWRRQS